MDLQLQQLLAGMPKLAYGQAVLFLPPLNAAMVEAKIITARRAAPFLATLAVESNELTEMVENLDHSAKFLVNEWPKHFSAATAPLYAHRPEAIANRAYADRLGNGPESGGDGWRYRGRGWIQLTGKAQYAEMGRALGVDLVGNPDMAATPAFAARVAGRYWTQNGCNTLADLREFVAITQAVNGGLTDLAARETYLRKFEEVLGV